MIGLTLTQEGDAMTLTRISADCHIDMPWIPPDLFTGNASAALRDRMPYVTDGPDGPTWTSKNGASFGLWGGVGPSGQKYIPGLHYRADVMASLLNEVISKRQNWLPELIETEDAMRAWEARAPREHVLRLYKFLNQLGYTVIGIDSAIERESKDKKTADAISDFTKKTRP